MTDFDRATQEAREALTDFRRDWWRFQWHFKLEY